MFISSLGDINAVPPVRCAHAALTIVTESKFTSGSAEGAVLGGDWWLVGQMQKEIEKKTFILLIQIHDLIIYAGYALLR